MNAKKLAQIIEEVKEKLNNGAEINNIKEEIKKEHGFYDYDRIIIKIEKTFADEFQASLHILMDKNATQLDLENSLPNRFHQSCKELIVESSIRSYKKVKQREMYLYLRAHNNFKVVLKKMATDYFTKEDIIKQAHGYYDGIITRAKNERRNKIMTGLGLIIFGIVLSIVIRFIMIDLAGGRKYFITSGMIIFGVIQLFRGLAITVASKPDLDVL